MHKIIKRVITAIILSVLFLSVFFFCPPIIFSILLPGILGELLIVELPKLLNPKGWAFWTIVPFYPILPFILLILLNQNPEYRPLILWLVVIVALHDSGSYIAGMLCGRHKIAPAISPAKTWEGFIGGYAITLTVILIMHWFLSNPTSPILLSLVILLICTIAFLGDLFESLLKRRAHIKDSADILPGHGGFLDRFDGILFASYFFYLFKDFLVQIFNV